MLKEFTGFGPSSLIRSGDGIRDSVAKSGEATLKTLQNLDMAPNAALGGELLQDLVGGETKRAKRQGRKDNLKATKAFHEWTTPLGKPCDPALGTMFCQQNTPEPTYISLKQIRSDRNERIKYYSDTLAQMESTMDELGILDDGSMLRNLPEKARKKVEKSKNKSTDKSTDTNTEHDGVVTEEDELQEKILQLNAHYDNWLVRWDQVEEDSVPDTGWLEDITEEGATWYEIDTIFDPFDITVSTEPPTIQLKSQREIFHDVLKRQEMISAKGANSADDTVEEGANSADDTVEEGANSADDAGHVRSLKMTADEKKMRRMAKRSKRELRLQQADDQDMEEMDHEPEYSSTFQNIIEANAEVTTTNNVITTTTEVPTTTTTTSTTEVPTTTTTTTEVPTTTTKTPTAAKATKTTVDRVAIHAVQATNNPDLPPWHPSNLAAVYGVPNDRNFLERHTDNAVDAVTVESIETVLYSKEDCGNRDVWNLPSKKNYCCEVYGIGCRLGPGGVHSAPTTRYTM